MATIPSQKSRHKAGLLPEVLFFLVLALLFTFPLIFHLHTHVAGDREGDMWKHLWGFWWVPDQILTEGVFPLFTRLLNSPFGGGLFFIDPLGGLFALPLGFFSAPPVVYNLLIIFNLVFGAFSAALLADRFVKNRAAAVVSGVIYAFSSYMLAHITGGVSETFNIGWIPLFLYFLSRTLQKNGAPWVIPGALSLAGAAFGSWYYGIIAVLLGLFYIAYVLVFRTIKLSARKTQAPAVTEDFSRGSMLEDIARWFPESSDGRAKVKIVSPDPPASLPEPKKLLFYANPFFYGLIIPVAGIIAVVFSQITGVRAVSALSAWGLSVLITASVLTAVYHLLKKSSSSLIAVQFKNLLAMGLLVAMMVGPVFVAFRSTMNEGGSMVRRDRTIEFMRYYLSEDFHNISMLKDYVTPGKDKSRRTYTVDRLTRSSFCGYVTLGLCILALFFARRKGVGFWAFITLFFVVFSLGPYLYLDRGKGLEQPFFLYKWFYLYFPFFSQVSIPYRFNLPAMLGMGVLGGYAFAGAVRHVKPRRQYILAAVLSLTIVLEIALLSPAPYPIPLSETVVPPFYRELATEKGEFGILDVPFQRGKGELVPGEYFYYQTVHGKEIPYTVEGTIPLYMYQNQFTLELYRLEGAQRNPACRYDVLQQYLGQLKIMKFRYIVVHDNCLSSGQKLRIHSFLRHFLGEPRPGGMGLWIYSL